MKQSLQLLVNYLSPHSELAPMEKPQLQQLLYTQGIKRKLPSVISCYKCCKLKNALTLLMLYDDAFGKTISEFVAILLMHFFGSLFSIVYLINWLKGNSPRFGFARVKWGKVRHRGKARHSIFIDNISEPTIIKFFGLVSILYLTYRCMFIIVELENSQYKTR